MQKSSRLVLVCSFARLHGVCGVCRQPLQLHGSAPEPRGDGAPGRGPIPGAGAQQQAPLRQELLLPQKRHLHTVSRRRLIVCTHLIVLPLSGVCRKVSTSEKCRSFAPVSTSLSLIPTTACDPDRNY